MSPAAAAAAAAAALSHMGVAYLSLSYQRNTEQRNTDENSCSFCQDRYPRLAPRKRLLLLHIAGHADTRIAR